MLMNVCPLFTFMIMKVSPSSTFKRNATLKKKLGNVISHPSLKSKKKELFLKDFNGLQKKKNSIQMLFSEHADRLQMS